MISGGAPVASLMKSGGVSRPIGHRTNIVSMKKWGGQSPPPNPPVPTPMCVYVYLYMFICTELIEETGRPLGMIFGMWGYFWPGSEKFEFWKNFHTFDGVMT